MGNTKTQFDSIVVFLLWFFLLEINFTTQTASANFEVETKNFKLVIDDNAQWQSIIDKENKRELCYLEIPTPFAEIVTSKGTLPASSLKSSGQRLEVGFKESTTRITYSINKSEDWVLFKLIDIKGARPKKMLLCQVPVNLTENIGTLLNIAWDNKTSICLTTANFQTTCNAMDKSTYALLRAMTQDEPGPKLEGAAVALIISKSSKIREILRTTSHLFGLLVNENPEGTPSKDRLYLPSYLYLFGKDVKESDANIIIDYCRKTNFKQVLLPFQSWAISTGHMEYNTDNFPDGKESIKRFVRKLNGAGIGAGVHAYVSKVKKTDKYITPVPDKRFWIDIETALACNIDAKDTNIRVRDYLGKWPGGPDQINRTWGYILKSKGWEGGERKHREFIIGDEIIKYEGIGPEGENNMFLGCERGAWGTQPAEHMFNDKVIHWGIDGCINSYIIDQETTLAEEVCDRLATIVNECGFNMIYFDGGEDVPKDRFMYYASLAQARVLRKVQVRPFIHMGTVQTNRLWHSLTIGSTVDNYYCRLVRAVSDGVKINELPKVKYHINESVKRVIEAHKNLMPGELGWFAIHRKSKISDGLQLDGIEYLMVKSLAYDAPISLQTNVSNSNKWNHLNSHPLTPEILNIVGKYESMRINREVPSNIRMKLRELNKDFVYICMGDRSEFVEVNELPEVGGTCDVRAFVGELETGDAVATIWHYAGKPTALQIQSAVGKIQAVNFFGNKVFLERNKGKIKVPIDSRRLTLIFRGVSKERAQDHLISANIL